MHRQELEYIYESENSGRSYFPNLICISYPKLLPRWFSLCIWASIEFVHAPNTNRKRSRNSLNGATALLHRHPLTPFDHASTLMAAFSRCARMRRQTNKWIKPSYADSLNTWLLRSCTRAHSTILREDRSYNACKTTMAVAGVKTERNAFEWNSKKKTHSAIRDAMWAKE